MRDKIKGEHVKITEAEAEELFNAIHDTFAISDFATLAQLYTLPPSGSRNYGVAISFDENYAPFFGSTTGFNKELRLPIKGPSHVLEQVKLWLKHFPRELPGGRAFLNNEGVQCDGIWIGKWEWPGENLILKFAKLHADSPKNKLPTK